MRKGLFLLAIAIIGLAQLAAQTKKEQLRAAPYSILRAGFSLPEGFTYANRDSIAKNKPLGIGGYKKDVFISALIELPQMEGLTIKGISYHTAATDSYGRICIATRNESASSGDSYPSYTVLAVDEVSSKEGVNTFTFKDPIKTEAGKTYAIGYECLTTGEYSGQGDYPTAWFPVSFVQDKYCFAQSAMVYFNTKAEGTNMAKVGSNSRYMNNSNMGWGNLAIVAHLEDPEGKLTHFATFAPPAIPGAYSLFPSLPSPEAKLPLPVVNLGGSDVSKISFEVKNPDGSTETREFSVNMKPTQGSVVDFALTTKGRGRLAITLNKVNEKNNACKEARLVFRSVPFGLFLSGEAVLRNKLLVEYLATEAAYQVPEADSLLAVAFESAKKKGIECIVATHHAGYKTDMLTLPNSEELLPHYTNPRTTFFAPGIVICRTFDPRITALARNSSTTLLFPHEAKNVVEILETTASFPSEVVLTSIEQTTNTDKTRNIVVKGKDLSGKLAASKALFLSIYRTEDGIPAKAQLGKGKKPVDGYLHNNAIREFVTPTWGTPVEEWSGNDFTITVSNVKVDDKWDNTKNHFVVFLHRDIRVEDPAFRFVYAANSIGVHQMNASRELTPEKRPIAIAREGRVEIIGAYDSFVIYNLAGGVVANNRSPILPAGIYIVKTRLGEVDYISKIVMND